MNRASTYSLPLQYEIENMKLKYSSVLIKLLTLQYLLVVCISLDFDYFYFVQHVRAEGSHYFSIRHHCCYPPTWKPAADFSIHGLWPNRNDGGGRTYCDPSSLFKPSEVSNLVRSLETKWPSLTCPSSNGETFWSHEWKKHGTCSESVFDQYKYFKVALELKKKVDLLQILKTEDILPDGGFYSPQRIKDAIGRKFGHNPGIRCSADASGNLQLFEISVCMDTSGSKIIECPRFPSSRCGRKIKFPSF